jgi:hypothetical protein
VGGFHLFLLVDSCTFSTFRLNLLWCNRLMWPIVIGGHKKPSLCHIFIEVIIFLEYDFYIHF